MPRDEDQRRTRIFRIAGVVALLVVVLFALTGFSILGSLGQGVVAEQTGMGTGPDGQLQVHGERLSATAFGDRFVFALRAAAGQVTPPAFPATFPIYPGSIIGRSAVYRDTRRTLRGVTYLAPTEAATALRWYRAALEAEGYRVTAGEGGSLEAVRGGRLVRIQPGPAEGPVSISLGVYFSEG